MPILKILKIALFFAAFTSFLLFLMEFFPTNNMFRKLDVFRNKKELTEEYDPSLSRLNTLEKLEAYCDSIYYSKKRTFDIPFSNDMYPGIAVQAIKQKFYHGYSHFGITDNYLARFLEPFFINLPVSAIVDPYDIVKYPMAACSQQSILFTKLLMDKDYNVRKVGFYNPEVGGHFAIEVFYNNSWHFYDPNKELDFVYLQSLNRPSAEFLANNLDILVKAYQYKNSESIKKLFPTYLYGKPNKIEGLNALIYQRFTKILSYTIWIFFLVMYLIVRKKVKQTSLLQAAEQTARNNIDSPLEVIYKTNSA